MNKGIRFWNLVKVNNVGYASCSEKQSQKNSFIEEGKSTFLNQ